MVVWISLSQYWVLFEYDQFFGGFNFKSNFSRDEVNINQYYSDPKSIDQIIVHCRLRIWASLKSRHNKQEGCQRIFNYSLLRPLHKTNIHFPNSKKSWPISFKGCKYAFFVDHVAYKVLKTSQSITTFSPNQEHQTFFLSVAIRWYQKLPWPAEILIWWLSVPVKENTKWEYLCPCSSIIFKLHYSFLS